MHSIYVILLLVLLIMGAGIAGIILVVTGILNNITHRWTLGAILVSAAIIVTAVIIGQSAGNFFTNIYKLAETQHQYDEKNNSYTDPVNESVIFDNIEFLFLDSRIAEHNDLNVESLYTFNIYADDVLFNQGFFVSNATIKNNQTYQFTVLSETPLNSNIQVYGLDDDMQELFRTGLTVLSTTNQSSDCIASSKSKHMNIPTHFLFRII